MSRSPTPAAEPIVDRSEPSSPRDSSEAAQEAQDISRESQDTEPPDGSHSNPPSSTSVPASAPPADSWQAVWSPGHSAYYFYNAVTHETTWVNPLQPNPEPEAGPSGANASPQATEHPAASTSSYDVYAAAAAQGIDPALAHLDPSLAAPGVAPGAFTYTAKFNARTGTFARPDGRDPTHLSEYERAKRMSEFYFDVNSWENDVEQRKLQEAEEEAEGKKRKRPTKKDLDRFKEQKRQKKLAKTAWLRT